MDRPISIYAELLPNIRQISLVVTLPSPVDASTSGTVSHSATTSTVHIHHSGLDASLTLPTHVAVSNNYRLPIPGGLEWRLPVARHAIRSDGSDSRVPWESKDLIVGGQVTCRNCGGVLVREGTVTVWKDLPAAGWEDMMDFWFCHQPCEDHHNGDGYDHDHGDGNGEVKAGQETRAARGYGAYSAIEAQQGVGFVDLTAFLFAEEDCEGIQPIKIWRDGDPSTRYHLSTSVTCKGCFHLVGYKNHPCSIPHKNHEAGGVTLFKWAVTVPSSCASTNRAPPQMEECISAELAATKARTGCSQFLLLPILHTGPAMTKAHADHVALLIQILTPAIKYASNSPSTPAPVPAMKILYRPVQPEERDTVVLPNVMSFVEPVSLAWEEIQHLKEGPLVQSTLLLPRGQRKFGAYRVGMLRTW